jgi:hypothetical protein
MLRKFTLRSMLFVFAMALFGNAYSDEGKYAPIQAMVQREQAINTFTTVTNIWQADNSFDKTALLTKVKDAQPLTIDYSQLASFMEMRYPDIQLIVPKLGGGTYIIDLVKYDIFSDGFKVLEDVNGVKMPFAYTPGVYYRGAVDGVEGTVAAFSFFKNEVYGIFSVPNEGNYTLVPNTMVGTYYDYNTHYLLYNDNDLLIKQYSPGCATEDFPEYLQTKKAAKTTTNLNEKVYFGCQEITVYELADHSTYISKGSSTANVTNYTTALFNNQSTLYKNEGVLVSLKTVIVNSTSDTYQGVSTSSSFNFLQRFGNNTQNNLQGADIAVLLSTNNGNLGGVAWLQTLCTPFATYASTANPGFTADSVGPYCYCNIDNNNNAVVNFPTYSWDVEVTTHEMGHILGSPHTHRCCWNPPGTGTTAIDGCYTLEPNPPTAAVCATPNPQYPPAGGTIMSYCHLTSVGTNFSNGFGTQPGDTIRTFIGASSTFINSANCPVIYNPSAAIATPSKTLAANKECTDPNSGITYYFNDNNTAQLSDDSIVLMVNKKGNNIGSMDITGFAVSTATFTGYGTGTGLTLHFPTGTPGILQNSISMRRYWKINATTQPTSNVEVMFPFLKTDTSDIDGSVPGNPLQMANVSMYKVNSTTVDPSPANGFAGATSSTFSLYTYGSTASASVWSLSIPAGTTTYLAHMLTTNLTGGGAGFSTYNNASSVQNVTSNTGINVYPNPVHEQWVVSVPDAYNTELITLQLYSADGKLMQTQALFAGTTNFISTVNLPVGFYFYRVIAGSNLFTGNLVKE